MTGFVGFKTTATDAKRYKDAAESRDVALSVLVRTAVDSFIEAGSHGIARNEAESLLLKAVRRDAGLAADLTMIGASASSDRDVRELVRRLSVLLSREKVGSPAGRGRKR